jgi:uncharacterized RDD family membrane protein YckC
VYLPVEGALAPNPQLTPPARGKGEARREIPGMKKKERTWKDEVRERVRDRRQQRTGSTDLPLFREEEEPETVSAAEPEAAQREAGLVELGAPEPVADDLPLRPVEAPIVPPASRPQPPPVVPAAEAAVDDDAEEEWPLEPTPPAESLRPVERPALLTERLTAAAVDVALLTALFGVIVYFASRAAQVAVARLLPSWPFLAGYLAFLGLVYAAYFTGTTGQTLGKILGGLRVVDGAGQPPGFLKAFVRAALGSASIALAGLGAVPMLLDPARRGLHDRLLKTRVVKF